MKGKHRVVVSTKRLRMQQQFFHHLHMSRKLKGSKEQQKYGKEKNEGT